MSDQSAAGSAWEAWLPIGTSVPSHERFTTDRASFIAGHASRDAEVAVLQLAVAEELEACAVLVDNMDADDLAYGRIAAAIRARA